MRSLLFLLILFGIHDQSFGSLQCGKLFRSTASRPQPSSQSQSSQWIDGQNGQSFRLNQRTRQSGDIAVVTFFSSQTLFKGPLLKEVPSLMALHARGYGSSGTIRLGSEPPVRNDQKTSPVDLAARFAEGTHGIAEFLGHHFQRRRWSGDFTQKAAEQDSLNSLMDQIYRTELYDQSGHMVGTGSLVYSPYLIVHSPRTGRQSLLPWLSYKQLAQFLETGEAPDSSRAWRFLPVEDFFSIRFDRPQSKGAVEVIDANGETHKVELGFLVEIKSFAVDVRSPHREQLMEELFAEFLYASYQSPFRIHDQAPQVNMASLAQDRRYKNNALFYTYGERVGQRLYRSPPFQFSTVDGVSRDAYGVSWKALARGRDFMQSFAQSADFRHVTEKIFDQLTSEGFAIENGEFRTPSIRSASQDMTDLILAEGYKKNFIKKTEKHLQPLFTKYFD